MRSRLIFLAHGDFVTKLTAFFTLFPYPVSIRYESDISCLTKFNPFPEIQFKIF